MTHFIKAIFTSLAIFCFSTIVNAALPLTVDGKQLPSLAPMLEKIQSAIVNISTTRDHQPRKNPNLQDPFYQWFFGIPRQGQRKTTSLGSGVVVNANQGYIITNHHVVEYADEISVTTKDGRELKAALVGSDSLSDIAIIKIDANTDGLIGIPFGHSDALRVGDFVVAIGNPFGLSQTVTSGIVSALGRSGLGIVRDQGNLGYEDFIQTDASINPGNSGGALVNLKGELVGINTAILSRSGGSVGVGFAIPVDMVKSIMVQLIDHGEVKRGLLGVRMQDLTLELADIFDIPGKKGALINEIIPDSAADKSGIKEGDVIISFGKQQINNSSDLRNAVGVVRPGTTSSLTLYRDGKLKTIKVKIHPVEAQTASSSDLGKKFTGAYFKDVIGDGEIHSGILVGDIEPGSPAANSGLKTGDLIVSINRKPVKTLKELRKKVKKASGGLLLGVIRNGYHQYTVIR